MPGAGSTQTIFHSPTGSPEPRAAAPWASPVKILQTGVRGVLTPRPVLLALLPSFGPVKNEFCEHSGGAAAQARAVTPFPVR